MSSFRNLEGQDADIRPIRVEIRATSSTWLTSDGKFQVFIILSTHVDSIIWIVDLIAILSMHISLPVCWYSVPSIFSILAVVGFAFGSNDFIHLTTTNPWYRYLHSNCSSFLPLMCFLNIFNTIFNVGRILCMNSSSCELWQTISCIVC